MSSAAGPVSASAAGVATSLEGVRGPDGARRIDQVSAEQMGQYVAGQLRLAYAVGSLAAVCGVGQRGVLLLVHRAGCVLDGVGDVDSNSATYFIARTVLGYHGVQCDSGASTFEEDLHFILDNPALRMPGPVLLDVAGDDESADQLANLHLFPQYYRALLGDNQPTRDFLELAAQFAALQSQP